MSPRFAVSYKEPSWEWEESPTQYFWTPEDANNFYWQTIQQGGRFRCIQIHEIKAPGIWVLLDEIDLGPRKNSN